MNIDRLGFSAVGNGSFLYIVFTIHWDLIATHFFGLQLAAIPDIKHLNMLNPRVTYCLLARAIIVD